MERLTEVFGSQGHVILICRRWTSIATVALLSLVVLWTFTATASATSAPHVTAEEDPDTCAMCHRAHTAMGSVQRTDHSDPWETTGSALVVATPSDIEDAALCLMCHGVDSLGSEITVQADFTRASTHSIAPEESAFGPSPKRCSSCHDAHGSDRDGEGQPYARLLRAFTETGTAFFSGEEYCTTCHFDSRDEEGNRFDGLEVYSLTAHAGMDGPVSGTEITCSNCHAPHGSDFAPLIRDEIVVVSGSEPETATVQGNDRTLCYACHTDEDDETTWDGEGKYELSVHGSSVMTVPVTAEWASEETTRLAGECQNCHNPMGRDDGEEDGRLVPKLTETEGRELCYSCHNEEYAEDEERDIIDMESIAVSDASFGEELVVTWDPSFLPEKYGAMHVYTRETTETPSSLEGPRRYLPVNGSSGRTGAIAYGDIDGLGDTELVVADPNVSLLRVFRYDPLAGIAEAEQPYDIDKPAIAIEISDFIVNGEGLPEVAVLSVAPNGESSLRLYRFTGSGFQGVAGPVSVGSYATGLASGNLTGSSPPAFVVTAMGDDPDISGELRIVSVSNGTLTVSGPFETRRGPRGPSIGDVITGESGNEIVVANSGETTGTVSVFLADGTEHSNYDTALPAGAAAWDTAVGAFRPGSATGVGVAVRNETGDSGVCVFPAGTNELGSRADYVTGERYATSSLAVGDVDGDGQVQLVVGNAGVLTTATAESVSPSVRLFRVNDSSNLVLGDELWAGGTEMAGGAPGLAVVDLGPVGRSRHPVGAVEKAHVSTETAGFDRHVECMDCHNVHVATIEIASAPNVYGALAGAWGVDISGVEYELKKGVDYEYEVCFKCHGDASWSSAPRDIEAEFSRVSSHPVVENPPEAELYCIDCHGNADDAQASGPHVSSQAPLLSSPFIGARPVEAEMLCYGSGCHAKSLYHDGTEDVSGTGFRKNGTNLHALHTGDDGYGIGCEACHLNHGSVNEHLIRDGFGWSQAGRACSTPCHVSVTNTY